MSVTILALAALLSGAPQEPQPTASPEAAKAYGLLIEGEAAEAFLRTAQVVERKSIGVGVTSSSRLTLSDGTRTLRAAWKTVDESRQGITSFAGGGFEVDFRDSYKFEIASYELDKLLGLGLVPPTVERRIKDETGSLQLWVEGAMTEWERMKKKVEVKDPERWNAQIYKVRLLHQLTYDTDYNNIRNVLVDPELRIYAIDFSRAFRGFDTLLSEKDLKRFSRSALEKLALLDRPLLDQKLGRWLTGRQIDALLKRRDTILALAKQRVAEKGEAAVLYP